ncbi:hypothetical protein [Flavobacterium humi]|nr:hypothetical protein [Flavobacterium humi]
METKKHTVKDWLQKHPSVIVLAIVVISYSGYLFGQWMHTATH